MSVSNKLVNILEIGMFRARWLLAPFFVGLLIAIGVLLLEFVDELVVLLWSIVTPAQHDTVISVLTLVDITLIAILLMIIVFSGYENFVSKLGIGDHEDRPAWMARTGFSDLKIKLISAIVAISAVELLKVFLESNSYENEQLAWKVGIHLTFVLSGVLFALTDYIAEKAKLMKEAPER